MLAQTKAGRRIGRRVPPGKMGRAAVFPISRLRGWVRFWKKTDRLEVGVSSLHIHEYHSRAQPEYRGRERNPNQNWRGPWLVEVGLKTRSIIIRACCEYRPAIVERFIHSFLRRFPARRTAEYQAPRRGGGGGGGGT